VAEPITRAEVLREFGAVIAKLRDQAEKARDNGKPPSEATKRRLDCLHAGYLFIVDNWKETK
jgi:hypothetical protein